MPGLDISIVEHHIDTWPYANPIRQNVRPTNPTRQEAIKDEIDKIKQACFIYLIECNTWVSNLARVLKKQGTIRVCTDFHDLQNYCLKYNFPTPFIDQIINECAWNEALSFMDGFYGYNHIVIC